MGIDSFFWENVQNFKTLFKIFKFCLKIQKKFMVVKFCLEFKKIGEISCMFLKKFQKCSHFLKYMFRIQFFSFQKVCTFFKCIDFKILFTIQKIVRNTEYVLQFQNIFILFAFNHGKGVVRPLVLLVTRLKGNR